MNHEVSDLRSTPGELSFQAHIGERSQPVWFRSPGSASSSASAVVPACLVPTMHAGGTLAIDGPVSPRLLRNQREFQAVQMAWSLAWEFGNPPLREVEITAPGQVPAAPQPDRVAAFFSGGVDSWATILDHPEITDLIFVRGFDLIPGSVNHEQVAPEVEARVRMVAERLELGLHIVESNLRELSDPLARWETYFNSAFAAVAHFLAPRFGRVLLSSGMDHEVDSPVASAWLVDHLWSSEHLEVADTCARWSRVERTRRIARHPLVRQTLRVCWENPDGAYNCGRCRKCLMTMITLEALGARESIETFPAELDLSNIAAIEIEQVVLLAMWEDVLDVVRANQRADLELPVEEVVEGGKRRLGLPLDYRRRLRPGPTPLRPARRAQRPSTGDPETLTAVLNSRSWRLTAPLRRLGAAARRIGRLRGGA